MPAGFAKGRCSLWLAALGRGSVRVERGKEARKAFWSSSEGPALCVLNVVGSPAMAARRANVAAGSGYGVSRRLRPQWV